MKTYNHRTGITLIEMLIVLAVIVILAAIAIGVATRVDNKAKEQLTENTIAILTAALGEFRDYGYRYKHAAYNYYFDFPLHCNDLGQTELEETLGTALGGVSVLITGGTHQNAYSGSEALYFFLSKVPASRKTLDEIDGSLITNEGSNRTPMIIKVDGKEYPLLRFIDPWGNTLRYDYYKRSFPVITSAGPDGLFDTADDITSR